MSDIHLHNEIHDLKNKLTELKQEVAEYEASFDLYNKASQRGREMFFAAHGKEWDLKSPDQGHLICWLIELVEDFRTGSRIEAGAGDDARAQCAVLLGLLDEFDRYAQTDGVYLGSPLCLRVRDVLGATE